MLSLETYAIIGGFAVLPYVAEAAWNWARRRRTHRRGAIRRQ
jgi:hypothetical protein